MSEEAKWQDLSIELALNAKKNLDAKDDEITTLRQQLAKSEARVAVQFDALTSIAVALKGAGNLTKEMHDFIVAATDGYSEAILLRKQAEAVEAVADKLEGMNLMRPDEFLRSNAQRLRQQADEAERAGGEQ